MRISTLLGAGLATLVAGAASAEITGAYVINYSVTAADYDGAESTVYVQDLYLSSDDGADVALNDFNYNASATAASSYFQSFTGTGWQPTNLGGPFDAAALRSADSFVTIGGFEQGVAAPEQAPGAGSGTGAGSLLRSNGVLSEPTDGHERVTEPKQGGVERATEVGGLPASAGEALEVAAGSVVASRVVEDVEGHIGAIV
jgi:hypothetical protein